MPRKAIIYCDESVSKGRYFSNFYGGLYVDSKDHDPLSDRLESAIQEMGLKSEIKWASITPSVLDRYLAFADLIFDELESENAKIRVMFTQNRHVPLLTPEQRESSYHRLYYQFVKWGFGLEHASTRSEPLQIHLRLDKLPSNAEQNLQFKSFLAALGQAPHLRESAVQFGRGWIEEIDSKKHMLAQALDLVLGAMAFRLNHHHLAKPDGQRNRGKRTVAKEKVYKRINSRIRLLYPNFNIGVSTGQPNGPVDRWDHAYRHWLFVPKGRE